MTAMLFLLQGCGGNSNTVVSKGQEVRMDYAENLTMEEFDGYTIVKIRNPWDTTKILQSYALVENPGIKPEGFSEKQIIKVPLEKSIIYSSVHAGLINEFGSLPALSGVCDTEYMYEPEILNRIKSGVISDCGSSEQPNVEMIMKISPGAVLLSPYENSGSHGKLGQAGIPIVECADYMESSPLARAEWMKFYGRLYGKKEKADSMFRATEEKYLALKHLVANLDNKPKIMFDRVYGQIWSQPGGVSTTGILIEDAGGENPFHSKRVSGSLQLSPERVLYEAQDADIWLIRYFSEPITLKALGEEKELYTKFKAYKDGNVYWSNTSESRIFEDVAFHPHWLLGSFIRLFHPELSNRIEGKNYFERLKD